MRGSRPLEEQYPLPTPSNLSIITQFRVGFFLPTPQERKPNVS